MQLWGSLLLITALVTVHVTVQYWRFLKGPRAAIWLSISAGTALAYVFAYLLPKLAIIQMKITESGWEPVIYFMHNHAYLLALAGLLTFFALERSGGKVETGNSICFNRQLLLQIVVYGLYNIQLGYLASEMPRPEIASYLLVAVILNLHLMGVDHFILHRNPPAYTRLLRWVYAVAIVLGWSIGQLTTALEYIVVLCGAFVAGGIIIIAIRDELPGHPNARPTAFFIAVFAACLAILLVQSWQTG
jgi:hypothetical protein